MNKAVPFLRLLVSTSCAVLGALQFSACISDGPNHTGQDLLASQGIVLGEPLYPVQLNDFPLDSLVIDTPAPVTEVNRSDFVVGAWESEAAQARLSFRLEEPGRFSDLPENGVKLSLTYRKYDRGIAYLDSAKNRTEAVRLRAVVYRKPIEKEESGKLKDNSAEWRKFIHAWEDLNDVSVTEDTLVLKSSSSYDADSMQVLPLPRLRDALRGETTAMQIHIHLEAIAFEGDETPPNYLARLTAIFAGRNSEPHLLLGNATRVSSAPEKWQVRPLASGSGLRAVGFRVSSVEDNAMHRWPRQHIVHFVNRDTLLARISAALPAQFSPKPSNSLNLQYFIPYAEAEWTFADSLIRMEGDYSARISLDFSSAKKGTDASFRDEAFVITSAGAEAVPGNLISSRKNRLVLPITHAAQSWLNQANPESQHMLRLKMEGTSDSAHLSLPYPVFGSLPKPGAVDMPRINLLIHIHPLRDR